MTIDLCVRIPDSLTISTYPLATSVIDHGAIARNLERVRAASGADVMAVVKADAFGHGSVEVARTALAAGATWLGVATVDEALALRAAGITAPVFAWIVDPWVDLGAAIRAGITLSCANAETLLAIRQAAATAGTRADVHLEVDTGMARGGSTEELFGRLCTIAARAERVDYVRVTGVWSHLALAALPGQASVDGALVTFRRAVATARAASLNPRTLHIANSAAALAHPETALTLVRTGAALYGIETVESRDFALEPALRLTSRVTQLREVAAGTGVGYLHRFRTMDATTLALVPLGYGDGVPRALSALGNVTINGQRCPIRGAISMDQLVVEVPPSVRLGDEVVLLGSALRNEPTAAEWANLTGTIAHEILTGLGSRITRTHARGAA